jgi:hypothetical protein
MLDTTLYVCDAPAGISLVPGTVEFFRCCPQLDEEVARQVLGLCFAAFLAPEARQGRFIAAHDDPGVRIAYEGATLENIYVLADRAHFVLHPSWALCATLRAQSTPATAGVN